MGKQTFYLSGSWTVNLPADFTKGWDGLTLTVQCVTAQYTGNGGIRVGLSFEGVSRQVGEDTLRKRLKEEFYRKFLFESLAPAAKKVGVTLEPDCLINWEASQLRFINR